MTMDTDRSAPRWLAPLWVAGCCALTLLAKLDVNAGRTAPNHGDSSFYWAVARSVYEGRGFVIDYVWNFWNHPAGIPTPANVWWMPLASVLGAIGMWIGGPSYAAAQAATIVFSSLLPWVVYLLGRDLFRHRGVGMLGALLAATFHLFLDQPSTLLSHSPYVVLASLSLWLVVRAAEDDRWLKWCGASIALTQLARSDAVMLFGALAVALLAGRRPRPRALAGLVLGYALVMAPWWANNLAQHGAPMPGGALRAMFLRHYEHWYALPERVTRETWLQDGWEPVLELKQRISAANLRTLATGMVTGAPERERAWGPLRAWLGDEAGAARAGRDEPPPMPGTHALVALWALSLLGLPAAFRRRFLPFWTLIVLEWTFYSLVFTAVGMESFRTGMFSLYPVLVLCGAAGLLGTGKALARGLARGRAAQRLALGLVAAGAGAILLGQLAFARASMATKVRGIDDLNAVYATMRRKTFDDLGLSEAVVMTRDVHQLNAIAGMKGVMLPAGAEADALEVARRYEARHLLLSAWGDMPLDRLTERAWLRGIDANPRYRRVSAARMKGISWALYELPAD